MAAAERTGEPAAGVIAALTGMAVERILPRMSAGLLVELERLVAEASLTRARLGEIGRTIESCRERLHVASSHPPPAEPAAGDTSGRDHLERASSTAPAPGAPAEFDPTWGQGPA